LPKGSGFFEIDVNTGDGRKVLEYMSYLLNYHFNEGGSQSTVSFLVKSANGDLDDGSGDFLITRNGIFGVGNLYSPHVSEETKSKFSIRYDTDLKRIQFNDYYVTNVNPVIAGQEIEISTRDYIELINEQWNLIWSQGTLLLNSKSLSAYVLPEVIPILYMDYGNRYF